METTRAKTHIRPPRYTSKGLLEAILLSKKPILARRSPSITSLNESGSTRSSSSASSHRDTPPIRLRVKDHRSTSETRKSYHSLNNVPVVSAASWCVMEGSTGHIVYGHSDQEIKEIASLTKIMTCYLSLKLTLNFKVNLTTVLIISEKAASVTGTSAELRTGDAITLRDLLFGLMLPSGNDAA